MEIWTPLGTRERRDIGVGESGRGKRKRERGKEKRKKRKSEKIRPTKSRLPSQLGDGDVNAPVTVETAIHQRLGDMALNAADGKGLAGPGLAVSKERAHAAGPSPGDQRLH